MDDLDTLDIMIAEAVTAVSPHGRVAGPCPDAGALGAYIDGYVRDEMEDHLSCCDTCLGVVLSARGWYNDAPLRNNAPLAARPGLMVVVARVFKDALELVRATGTLVDMPTTALMPRGGNTGKKKLITLRERMGGVIVEVDLENAYPELAEVSLMTRDIATLDPYPGLRASLFHGGRERSSTVMEDGRATFERLQPADYIIKLTRDGELLGEIDMRIQGGRR